MAAAAERAGESTIRRRRRCDGRFSVCAAVALRNRSPFSLKILQNPEYVIPYKVSLFCNRCKRLHTTAKPLVKNNIPDHEFKNKIWSTHESCRERLFEYRRSKEKCVGVGNKIKQPIHYLFTVYEVELSHSHRELTDDRLTAVCFKLYFEIINC
ncbi:hypothetical protein EVAR_103471_1 [Eumeta japonica]|uniref:Uncharacterized protein n=1 Tax=Eumeta variegata TaxID=151549 RepID=A0A4C1YZ52_EUMVA|nr:hypothetical protein EVAR_103471_1 [Eumeta japonica]